MTCAEYETQSKTLWDQFADKTALAEHNNDPAEWDAAFEWYVDQMMILLAASPGGHPSGKKPRPRP